MRFKSTGIESPAGAGAMLNRLGASSAGVAGLLAVSAALLMLNLGTRVFATNDEARFPMLARDILAEGHWLLPRLDGVPHLNKPPLHAWLIALASWPMGAVTQWTASVPSVFAALVVVLATYWMARRLFGAETALVAGLTVLTTLGVFSFGRESMPDMTFSAATTTAMAAFIAFEVDGRRGALVLFYGLVGMAFWTKGPAGLLPVAVAAAYCAITYGSAGLWRIVSAPAVSVLALSIFLWAALVVGAPNAGPFVNDVVIADLLQWYVPTGHWHWRRLAEPFLQALTILLPWSVLLPGALWAAARPSGSASARGTRVSLVWLVVMFALIAIGHQQRMRYYLPLCPPAALLIAGWYERLAARSRAVGFAAIWILVASGGIAVDAYARARHNAATNLVPAVRELSQARRVYAVDAPELVFSFYLQRPVTALASYRDFETGVRKGQDGRLIIAERAAGPTLTRALPGLPAAVVGGRRFVILSCGATPTVAADDCAGPEAYGPAWSVKP
jgi:4-amino-4-deoxy-L-arabinose transferase-like glycosyltransferase